LINGSILIENKHELKHDGISVSVEGFVDLHFNLRTLSFMDTFYGSNKSIAIMEHTLVVAKAGKLLPGRTEIP